MYHWLPSRVRRFQRALTVASIPSAAGTPGGTIAPWNFHKNFGMRIGHLQVSAPLAGRTVWSEIDREACKGKPVPSDPAPLVIDIDEPGLPFDAGWALGEGRIAARRSR